MAFCQKCGSEVKGDTKFCGSCGAPVGEAPGAAAGGAPAAPSSSAPASAPMASNVAGLLTYVLGFITGIIFLVIEPYKNDKFVRFHAFQSIFYSAGCFILGVVWAMFTGAALGFSFSAFWALVFWVWVLLRLAFFLIWLFLMYQAYNNKRYELPFIGPLAAKQAG
jgi:uncharacterized membrane protein